MARHAVAAAVLLSGCAALLAPVARPRSTALHSTSVKEMSDMMREQRKLMEEDEQTKLVMQALRGANTNEDDFQDANVRMKVVEMREGEKDLPTTYDPGRFSRLLW